jgi:hypothetical protein
MDTWTEEELEILKLTLEEQIAYNEYMFEKSKRKKRKKSKKKSAKKARRKNRK